MKKFFKMLSLASVSALLLMGSTSCEEPGMEVICYYGVTMTVTTKIAKRYVKLGAEYGPCGQQEPNQ